MRHGLLCICLPQEKECVFWYLSRPEKTSLGPVFRRSWLPELFSCFPWLFESDGAVKIMCDAFPVLVVEDEEILLSFLKTALERGGLNAVGATSGAEALDFLEQREFACVVSDLRMPGAIGGSEIFDWVRENRPGLSSRFLFITGNVSDAHAIETRERTGAAFIEKPFRIALLIELIKKIMARNETVYV
jgi:CheY-like chemotaxis protein